MLLTGAQRLNPKAGLGLDQDGQSSVYATMRKPQGKGFCNNKINKQRWTQDRPLSSLWWKASTPPDEETQLFEGQSSLPKSAGILQILGLTLVKIIGHQPLRKVPEMSKNIPYTCVPVRYGVRLTYTEEIRAGRQRPGFFFLI